MTIPLTGKGHLSSLREVYLQRLADELKLRYYRLESTKELASLLLQSEFAIRRVADTDLRWPFGALALLALASTYLAPIPKRRKPRVATT